MVSKVMPTASTMVHYHGFVRNGRGKGVIFRPFIAFVVSRVPQLGYSLHRFPFHRRFPMKKIVSLFPSRVITTVVLAVSASVAFAASGMPMSQASADASHVNNINEAFGPGTPNPKPTTTVAAVSFGPGTPNPKPTTTGSTFASISFGPGTPNPKPTTTVSFGPGTPNPKPTTTFASTSFGPGTPNPKPTTTIAAVSFGPGTPNPKPTTTGSTFASISFGPGTPN